MSWFRSPKPPTPERSSTPPAEAARPAATGIPDDDDEIPIDVNTGTSQVVAVAATSSGARPAATSSSTSARTSGARPASSTGGGAIEGRTTLTDDTTIVGSITTASDLWIAGRIEGDIESGAAVHIASDGAVVGDVTALRVRVDHGGSIEGSVEAGDAAISGRVKGSVSSTGKLAIASSGEVVGDVTAHSLHVDDGATLQGRCTMTRGGAR